MSERETADFSAGSAYVDGRVVPIGEARISILDSGFGRSDATYDVVAVWEGAFFRLEDHLDRFASSCEALRMTPPVSRAEIAGILADLVAASDLHHAFVEMICTRGVPVAGSRDPRTFVNRFYALRDPLRLDLASGPVAVGDGRDRVAEHETHPRDVRRPDGEELPLG